MLPGSSNSSRSWPGRWTRDGRYFFFTAWQRGTRNIWALRDKKDILRKNDSRPMQLTEGPLDYFVPTPSSDGKTIYAVGAQPHGQLMRYDAHSREFEPYANGQSIDHVAFSRDGKWMAYVTYPEGTLVRSRIDGSEPASQVVAGTRRETPIAATRDVVDVALGQGIKGRQGLAGTIERRRSRRHAALIGDGDQACP